MFLKSRAGVSNWNGMEGRWGDDDASQHLDPSGEGMMGNGGNVDNGDTIRGVSPRGFRWISSVFWQRGGSGGGSGSSTGAWWPAPRERRCGLSGEELRNVVLFLAFLMMLAAIIALLYFLDVKEAAPIPGSVEATMGKSVKLATGAQAAVAADLVECSEIGIRVLRTMNGTAADAAVVVALCQGILNPFASGLGGGAFILGWDAGSSSGFSLDAREVAPAKLAPSMFAGENRGYAEIGGKAVGVPGELRGLELLHRKMGKLRWAELVALAIETCETAKVGPSLAKMLREYDTLIRNSPSLSAVFTKPAPTSKRWQLQKISRYFLVRSRKLVKDRSVVLEEGDPLVQTQLASTLKIIAEQGASSLYTGKIAQAIVADVQARGGVISVDDMKHYSALERTPIESFYDGKLIMGVPPPSVGGVVLAFSLNILEGYQLRRLGRNGNSYHLITESLKFAFSRRNSLGDPDSVPGIHKVVSTLVDKAVAMRAREGINLTSTYPPSHYSNFTAPPTDHGTSHISILDKDGNAVSMSSSLNLAFGAQFLSSRTGLVMNNQMSSFSLEGGDSFGLYPTEKNELKPGRRPLSSMTPTIVLHNGKPHLVLGGSGGPLIISAVLQALLNVMEFGDEVDLAVGAPRLHHQLIPNVLFMESIKNATCAMGNVFPIGDDEPSFQYWSSACSGLKTLGHNVSDLESSASATHVIRQAYILQDSIVSRHITAASDPRRSGVAIAY